MFKYLAPVLGAGIVLAAFATMPQVWAQGVNVPLHAEVEIPAALSMIPIVGEFLQGIQKWLPVVFQVIGAFSMVAALTANETDDKVINYLLKGVNVLGFNFGTAKNDPNVGVNKAQ